MLTLGQAARMTGLGKTTVARAIKAGRLSATRTELGNYEIDPAELSRVFPIQPVTETNGATVADTVPVVHHATAVETAIKLTLTEERLAEVKSQLDDMRAQRDRWQAMCERLSLVDLRPATRSWWWKR